MAEGLRSKSIHEPTKDDEKQQDLDLALSSMLTSALKEQQSFTEKQFGKFEEWLDTVRAEVSKNSTAIKKLKEDHKVLSTHVTKSESFQKSCSKIEASIAELEDRSCRDNIRIIKLPERIEASEFISSSLPKWLPTLAGEKMEVMKAHRIGPRLDPEGSQRFPGGSQW